MILSALLTRGAFLGSTAFSSLLLPSIPSSPTSSPADFIFHDFPTDPSSLTSAEPFRAVRDATRREIATDPTLAGPLLRLAFHDAATREALTDREKGGSGVGRLFTGGPNGSVRYETDWMENRGLSRPLKAAERIYANSGGALSSLSFADVVALAGAEAVEAAGGPHIPIRTGRPDAEGPDPRVRRRSLRSGTDRSTVETTLPSAGLDSDGLRLYFGDLGLTEEEMVALCGAHDLGRHVTLLGMPKGCRKNLTRECLEEAPVMMPFVSEGPDTFSNVYFQKLLKWDDRKVELGEVAFIPTDVDLVVDKGLRRYVQKFANNKEAFFRVFVRAYQKLVDVTATSANRY